MKRIIFLSLVIGLVGCESKEAKKKRLDSVGYNYVQEIVKNDLIDPVSAQFKNQKGFCGEVNSKNKMGGYVGFKKFIVLSPTSVFFEDEINLSTKQFPNAWESICKSEFEFKDEKITPPSFKVPQPVYDKPSYHFDANVATATPSSTVLKEGIYIYPILQIHCKEGETSFALYSMKPVSYSMDNNVGIKIDDNAMQLIPYSGDDDYLVLRGNEYLNNALKSAKKINISFRSIDNDFSMQEFNLKDLRDGMRKQKNSCGWDKL